MNIKVECPNCGAINYYMECYQTCTAMYYPSIYENGVNINPDGNITTTVCRCRKCNKIFSYQTRYGELYERN